MPFIKGHEPFNSIDLSGKRFGRLIAIKPSNKRSGNGCVVWECLCDCGKKTTSASKDLNYGQKKSCGCLYGVSQITHGMSKNPETLRFYHIWQHIKSRCNNSNLECYKNYGGRGIKVCKRWNRFENFRDDMLFDYNKHVKKYGEKNTTIDRIKNNLGYNKENCKWHTSIKQGRNKRSNRIIEFNGKKQIMIEWAEEIKISPMTLSTRINTYKWSIKKALTESINIKFRHKTKCKSSNKNLLQGG